MPTTSTNSCRSAAADAAGVEEAVADGSFYCDPRLGGGEANTSTGSRSSNDKKSVCGHSKKWSAVATSHKSGGGGGRSDDTAA